jgi:hypothetical protein
MMKIINYRTFFLILILGLQLNSSKYVIGHWSGGLGICITSALNHLLSCEQRGLTPVVRWYKTYYYNPNGFNGTNDEWEYYFRPVSNLKYNNGDNVNFFCTDEKSCGKFNYYDSSQEKRDLASKLINKYIALNAIVHAKVNNFYNNNMVNLKTIGIHIRGTDKKIENTPVAPERAVSEALRHSDENTQFFIATDEKKLLDRMLELLKGRKVVYYDCYRSTDGKPLHISRHKPSFSQLGEDVIVEMWIMSKCNMLIHTLSNVSSIPLYINPDLKHITLQ